MRDAEAVGYDWVVFPDSPALIRELYVTCAAFALSSERARFGPMVTNPVSRHPSVTAGAMLSLHELAPGRVALGVGGGDSAVYGVGMRAPTVAGLEEYTLAVKGLLRGEEVTFAGRVFRAEWRQWQPPLAVKVHVSAHGPRTMRMAARVADGVVSGYGMRPENIAFARETVEEAAREAGRDPDDVEILVASLRDPGAVPAGRGIRGAHQPLPHPVHHGRQADPRRVPGAHPAHVRGGGAAGHAWTPQRDHAAMARDSGVLGYLLEREGGLVGSPEEMCFVVRRWRDAGADRILFAPLGHDFPTLARRLADHVLPAFR